jgi:CRISPR system Cascade subunit CasD
MSVLLLRLAGPMQSWGIQSQFPDRDTGMEPSKSGVVGLLCAALGRGRSEPVNDLAELHMAVRVDWQGSLLYDYQTAMNVREASAKPRDVAKGKGIRGSISKRFYLSDACFLVGLESDDQNLLAELHGRLREPAWPLYLGRKAFVPGEPVWLENGWRPDETLIEVIRRYDWLVRRKVKDPPKKLRVVVDAVVSTDEPVVAEQVRPDYPISLAERRFAPRQVKTLLIETPGG